MQTLTNTGTSTISVPWTLALYNNGYKSCSTSWNYGSPTVANGIISGTASQVRSSHVPSQLCLHVACTVQLSHGCMLTLMLQTWQTLQPYSRNAIQLGGNFESTDNSWDIYGATVNNVWCAIVKQ